jgi:ribokinase
VSVCALGSVNMDIVLSVPRLPRPGETVSGATLHTHPGGKGANQAIAAARLGARTEMLGAVGTDAYGDTLLGYLGQSGVGIAGVRRIEGADTGQAYICVAPDGENLIVTVPGANHSVTARFVASELLGGHAVYLCQLEVPAAAVATFFGSDAAKSGRRLLNAAPAHADARPVLELADVVIVNQTELATYCGFAEVPDSIPATEAAARTLITDPSQTIVVTLGAEGAIAVAADATQSVAGYPVEAVDTTGAGDCFCGAMAAELDAGAALAEALEFANAAAAIAVTRPGAGPSMPTREEVVAFRVAAGT